MEAAVGGPIALLREGDTITVDIPNRRLDAALSAEEMDHRGMEWESRPTDYPTGALAKYAKLVSSASEGAVTG